MDFSISPYVFPGIKKEYIPKSCKRYRKVDVSPEKILEIVADSCGVTVQQILGKSRKVTISDARHIFCAILRHEFDYGVSQIGKIVGDRDHTTAIHSVKTFNDRCQTEEGYKEHVDSIIERIYCSV